MKRTLDAVYENGVFKPLLPPALPNGQQVRLEFETLSHPPQADLLQLAAQVYAGLSEADVDEIERHALARPDFFRRPSP